MPDITANFSAEAITLADLEAERAMAELGITLRLFASFILFGLWYQALATSEFLLEILCTIGSFWTACGVLHIFKLLKECDQLTTGYHDNNGENGTDGEEVEVDLHQLSSPMHSATSMDEDVVLDSDTPPFQPPIGDDTIEPLSASSTTPIMTEDGTDVGTGGEVHGEEPVRSISPNVAPGTVRRAFTLMDLEIEREMNRRQYRFFSPFFVLSLFRLWLQPLDYADLFLMTMLYFGSSWTDLTLEEEDLDRFLAGYRDNDGENESNMAGMEVDFQRLSIRGQLAIRLYIRKQLVLASIQSQRNMAQSNDGDPDGRCVGADGVSDAAKGRWDRFKFQPDRKGYGSLSQIEELEKASKVGGSGQDEGLQCSICLGEYELGESLVCLPCKHVYHEDCVSSWCNNHIRCPLCNFDLESVAGDTASVTTMSTSAS